jgi:hypothetical protein
MTNAFAMVGLICGRFRDMPDDKAVAAVATSGGGTERLTYGHLRELLSSAFVAGDQLQRIASWHSRETAEGGMVGDYCVECGQLWPCETRRMADGSHEDLDDVRPSPSAGDS